MIISLSKKKCPHHPRCAHRPETLLCFGENLSTRGTIRCLVFPWVVTPNKSISFLKYPFCKYHRDILRGGSAEPGGYYLRRCVFVRVCVGGDVGCVRVWLGYFHSGRVAYTSCFDMCL